MIKLSIKIITIVFISFGSIPFLFSMSDKRPIIYSADEKEFITTEKSLSGKHELFLMDFRNKIFAENVLEERMKLLNNGLSSIQEQYIQRIDSTDNNFRISIHKNPDVEGIKKTIFFVSHYIIRGLLHKPYKSYPNDWYARTFYNFLLPIKSHPYISLKDKKDIYDQIHPKIKKLQLSEYHGATTIERSLLNKKKKRRYCW